MALVLTEEQEMLRDAAAGFLAEKASPAQLRALRDSDDELGFDPSVWREMVEMGWAAIAIPEAYGGLGYGYTGLGVVLEQVGRHLSPAPLQSTILLGATLLNLLGSEAQKNEWLAAIASGERRVAVALQEGAQFAPDNVAMLARRDGDAFVLSGEKRLVMDAAGADALIVVARSAGAPGEATGLSAFLVPADSAGVSLQRCEMVDARAYAAVTFANVALGADALLGDEGGAAKALQRTLDIGAVGVAAELLGLSLEVFERTVAYLRERKQFGRVIGSFQGLQHRAAALFAELELARSIVLKALQAVDADAEDLPLLASAAKAKLCEVAALASNEGVQMHGGIGMTDEYDIGFFLKRARLLQHFLGDEYYHLDRFARLGGY
jgi:alkylation response protein AidB-like acyl-CoA dehydrogenase